MLQFKSRVITNLARLLLYIKNVFFLKKKIYFKLIIFLFLYQN